MSFRKYFGCDVHFSKKEVIDMWKKCFTVITILFGLHIWTDVCAKVSLQGSKESQRKQNQEADRAGLTRIEDDEMLERFVARGFLVPLREKPGLVVDPRLQEKFRYVRPWTRDFLEALQRDFYKQFEASFQINSAVRTLKYQKELRSKNRNAASTSGDRQSSHPTGATVDIGKIGLTSEQIAWLRKKLLYFEGKGKIEAIEEHRQQVFHLMVFKQ